MPTDPMRARRSALLVDIAALRRQTGAVRSVRESVVIPDLEITTSRVCDGRVDVDLSVENVLEGIAARGHVLAAAEGECRRCLEPVTQEIDLTVHEIFELHPTEGETWPIVDDHIDLEPMVRESILLALPLTPLCRDECPGPQPDRFPTHTDADGPSDAEPLMDPRWAVLDELELDE